ncbi:baculoviral IAP repeat-containing protein 5a isoform X2 [Dunckerocampus dactyliophorus]|uniref:baculoviral IAP repeat-containing protein 5a isoform X2 n=1 Tax=Dunckerocampus dactyliophorus TaxID=161453 RepID=UPI0024068AC1|nr:baculoviral IAP repeat-containing protein 5a isoform X2 [Dunckerocampus dactyliophorus]
MELFHNDDFKMYFCENRLKTFEGWPFNEDCACTPENMAKAGFIYTPSDNSPDAAMCFFCLKELACWEPEDDPQKEHRSHSALCHFITLKKKVEDLTVEEFFKLQKRKSYNEAVDKFREEARLMKAEMLKMAMGKEQ